MISPVPGAAGHAAIRSAAERRAAAAASESQPAAEQPAAPRPDLVLTLSCPDRSGIVADLAGALHAGGANIEESQQFDDRRHDTFFMRLLFSDATDRPTDALLAHWRAQLAPIADRYGMRWELRRADAPYRTLLMVGQATHCLHDLLHRWQNRDLNMAIPAIVSNHPDAEPLARTYGVPFRHIPVTAEGKPAAEAQLRQLIAEHDIDLVVLARYMQVLSDELCRAMPGRIIDIHHSFSPSFAGARPYHQAFERGVKLIGATAHYVTADLDEGPIIEQDVARVDHRMTPEDLVRIGQDTEADVLTRAVKWHCDSRVILAADRTVVFT